MNALGITKIIVLLWFACHILGVQLITWAAPTISFNFGEKEKKSLLHEINFTLVHIP